MGPSGDSACANNTFRSPSLSRPCPVDEEVVELRMVVLLVAVDVTITAAGTEVVLVLDRVDMEKELAVILGLVDDAVVEIVVVLLLVELVVPSSSSSSLPCLLVEVVVGMVIVLLLVKLVVLSLLWSSLSRLLVEAVLEAVVETGVVLLLVKLVVVSSLLSSLSLPRLLVEVLEVIVDGVIIRTVVRVVICVDGAVEDRVLLMVVEETVELVLDLVDEGKVVLLYVELVVLE